ncbi:MAG: Ku protein, partial [Desulfitobacterium hafniense]
EIPKTYNRPEVLDQELTMARTLINSMDTPFDPASYHDEYQGKLRKLIEDKIAGKEVVAASNEDKGNVIDLMDALKASIEQNKPEKPKRARKTTKGA